MRPARFRPAAALLGLACGAAALWLALHHPLSGALAAAAVLVGVGVAAWRPFVSLALLLGLLPVAGLAPWTGWMLVEEFDLLLLALLAGAWARLAWPQGLPRRQPRPLGGARGLWWALVLAYAAATAVSVHRGLVDAGAWTATGFDWSWWHGWREPMNVLRTAKPLLAALLAWPVWLRLQARDPRRAAEAVGWGALAGLTVVSALAVWERWAWTGLTNFSTDYRSTALFWETHIGGAALDGFLALTLPFGFWALARARDRRVWALVCLALMLAGYAVLTTFSRGLYLALVVSVPLWWWMQRRVPHAPAPGASRPVPPLWVPALWVLVFGLCALGVFGHGGWRGLGALWLWLALAFLAWQLGLPMRQGGGPAGAARRWGPAIAAAVLGLATVGAAMAAPPAWKLPYLLFVLLGLATAGLVWWAARHSTPGAAAWAAAAWVVTGAAALAISLHWGLTGNPWHAAWAVGALALAVAAAQRWPAVRGPAGGRWRLPTLGALALSGLVVGSFGGGSYLGSRLASAEQDMQGRQAHWQRSASLLDQGGDLWWGIGVGRFAAHFAFSGLTTDQTGDYRWRPGEQGGGELVLTAGKHQLGFGELFRLSQRLPRVEGPVKVRWRAFVEQPTRLHLEICNKHLLYDMGCSLTQVALGGTAQRPQPLGWVEGEAVLQANGGWRSPVFSLALETQGARLRLARVELLDASGRELLHNGGFDEGLARWLPSSDRHHLPWHAKNLGLHLWVEQGAVGATLFGLLLAFVAGRLLLGQAREHPLAPPLLAGLVGMLVVGAFDSLIDVPRLAFACLWLMGVAATLNSSAYGKDTRAQVPPL